MSAIMRNNPSFNNWQTGFTLLEVLVALVLISIGLLGVATLQLTGMKNNHSAFYRTQASILTYQMIENMRANRKEADSGSYSGTLPTTCPTSPSGVVQLDLANWCTALSRLLPAGTGVIAYTKATGLVRITIQWDDSRGSAGGTAQQFILETQLCDPGGSACQ
jgi:type IV pilus assembly protein PilV